MGSSTIRFRGEELEANDTLLEICLLEVVRWIEAAPGQEAWLREMCADWRLQATSGFGFGVVANMDEHLTTKVRQAVVVDMFRGATISLAERGPAIKVEELRRSGIGGEDAIYTRDIPTSAVLEVARSFLALLESR